MIDGTVDGVDVADSSHDQDQFFLGMISKSRSSCWIGRAKALRMVAGQAGFGGHFRLLLAVSLIDYSNDHDASHGTASSRSS